MAVALIRKDPKPVSGVRAFGRLPSSYDPTIDERFPSDAAFFANCT